MQRHSIHSIVPAAGAFVLALCMRPSSAEACSTVAEETSFQWGAPMDNATDVPTDVILYYPIPQAAITDDLTFVPGTFSLTTAEGAVEVTLTARRAHYWNYELVPAEALTPNTLYELTGTWRNRLTQATFTKTIRFTTAAGPLEALPAMPDATIEHYQLTLERSSSCDPPATGTCLAFGDPESLVEVTHIDGLGQMDEPYLARGSLMTDIAGIEQGTPFECVQLRTRAMNGTYSEPQTLCRDDGALTQLTSADLGCTPDGLVGSSTPMDPELTDAGAPSGDEVRNDGARPSNEDADSNDTPTVEMMPNDASEMTDPMQAPGAESSSSSCSAVRPTSARPALGAWALCVALALLYVRRRTA